MFHSPPHTIESLFRLLIASPNTDILKWGAWNAALLVSGAKFAEHFGNIFHPVVGDYDLIGKHPNAEKTIRHVDQYTTCMQELKETLSPELELIETRVIAPAKELQTVMKALRKTLTKRDHKVRSSARTRTRLIGWAVGRLRSAQQQPYQITGEEGEVALG